MNTYNALINHMGNLFDEFTILLRTGEATTDIIDKASELREELALFSENPEEWQDPVCIPVENDLAPNTRMHQGLIVTHRKKKRPIDDSLLWKVQGFHTNRLIGPQ